MARYSLSLDIGTHLGWACARDGKVFRSGVRTLKSNNGSLGHREANFIAFLKEIKAHEYDDIFYEKVNSHAGWNTSVTVPLKLLGLLEYYLNQTTYPVLIPVPYASITVKRRFTGNHKAHKEEICEHCIDRGWKNGELGTALNHDEADAIAVMAIGLEDQGIELTF